MVKIVWTEPALLDLDAIVEYIALDKPGAAGKYLQKVLTKVENLETFPGIGKTVPELPNSTYRELSIPPCRVFYRQESEIVYFVHVLRSERRLRKFMLDESSEVE